MTTLSTALREAETAMPNVQCPNAQSSTVASSVFKCPAPFRASKSFQAMSSAPRRSEPIGGNRKVNGGNPDQQKLTATMRSIDAFHGDPRQKNVGHGDALDRSHLNAANRPYPKL